MRNAITATARVVFIFLLGCWRPAFSADVLIDLSIEPVTSKSRAVVLRAAAINTSKNPLAMLTWNTPLDGLRGQILRVSRDGKELPYQGIVTKRGAPTSDSFMLLLPGEQSDVTLIDLSASYDFTISGNYDVHFDTSGPVAGRRVQVDDKTRSMAMTEEAAKVEVEVAQPESFEVPEKSNLTAPISASGTAPQTDSVRFIGCTRSDAERLIELERAAASAATSSWNHLVNRGPADPGRQYTNWFGDVTEERYGKVRNCFSETKLDLQRKGRVFYCRERARSCGNSVFAYVKPSNSAHDIFLCQNFWNDLPSREYGTQYGAILHEVTHFDDVCSTRDPSSGKTESAAVARDWPDHAVQSAENYQYFTEGLQ